MKSKRSIYLLAGAILTMGVGIQMHAAMNVNFIDELLHGSSWQQGYLEALRETCGILSFFAVALLAGRSEPRIAVAMLLITGAGISAYSRLGTIPQLVFFSMLWSFGFHVWGPLSSSMALHLSKKGKEGQTMGTLGAIGSAGVFVSLGAVWLLRVYAGFGMRELFLIAGVVTALGAIPLMFMPVIRAEKPEVFPAFKLLAPRYRLYLGLELLDGMRKQIFILFAILALVREHGIKIETIAMLMLVNQVINLVVSPAAGGLVDRIGERRVLSLYFSGLIVVFIMYTLFRNIHALYAVYIIDSMMWSLSVAKATYANRIVEKGERTRLLAMGITMNHVGAVTLPLVGGALYSSFGYRFPFYCGAGIALLSLVIAQRVPERSSRKK